MKRMNSPDGHKPATFPAMWRLSAAVCILAAAIALISPVQGICSSSPPAGQPDTLRRALPAGPRPVKNWPVILDNAIVYTPAAADIDGDGRDEIAVGVRDCRVHLLDWKGRELPGWPCETSAWIARGPLMEDIDGDGEFEVSVGSYDGLLHMWREDGSIVEGWPVDLGGAHASAPAAVRSSRDGEISIVVSTAPGIIHLLSPAGIEREGWPAIVPDKTLAGSTDRRPTWTADLDGDGMREILHATSHPAMIYAFRLDGSAVDGFPLGFGELEGLGMAVDDGDAPHFLAATSRLETRIFNLKEGTEISLSPDLGESYFCTGPFFISSTGAGGRADMVMTSSLDGHVYLWDIEGRLKTGWPLLLDGFIYGIREKDEKHSVYGPPATFDVDGDGDLELILGCYDHHLYCFDLDGTAVAGWPVVLDDFIIHAVTFAQLDGEGPEELVVGQYGESVFAFHLDPSLPRDAEAHDRPRRYSAWPAEYYAVSIAILAMLLLLVHLLRMELTVGRDSTGRRIRGMLLFVLLVLLIRALFFAGDLYRYRLTMGQLERTAPLAEGILEHERIEVQALADRLILDLQSCKEDNQCDSRRSLRCLEQLADRNRLEYMFSGVMLADRDGTVVQGVGLGRGWRNLDDMGIFPGKNDDPVLLGDIPVFAAEADERIVFEGDTLRFFLLSSLLNRVPNDIADATGFSAHIQVDGRTMAWGGAGHRPYRSLRPWLGVVQPAIEMEILNRAGGPRLSIFIADEDFERPLSQWLDLVAVLILPGIYLLVARFRTDSSRVGLKKWWVFLFGALYLAGTFLIHRGRFETGPVPLSGRALEVLLHMAGIAGVVVALHHVVTSKRSRRLNFALLGSYLIVSLIPLAVIMIVGGNLFLGIQRGIIEKTMEDLEERADNMVLAFMGNAPFASLLANQGPGLYDLPVETSWLDFAGQHRYLFNYDLPSAYITLWAHDKADPDKYFTGYSYMAPRTGKLYDTRPGWTGDENVRGLFLDNGTAVIRAMRMFNIASFETDLVSHIPVDDKIISDMEDRLRVVPFMPRIHLEPAWLESTVERGRPAGWHIPYSSELVLEARGWNSGKPRLVVYRASMYIPTGGELVQVLAPMMLLILIPLGLSFWGAYTTFRRTARPLSHLLTGIRKVSDGDLEFRLGGTGKSEIGLATRSFDAMADSLQIMIGELAEKQKVEEVSKMKSNFISMVSHDLKTPLASIRGAAENVLEEVTGPVNERQRAYLEMILRSSGDLQRMITDLLDLSQIESGRLSLNIVPFDIRREAEDHLGSVAPILESKGIKGRLTVRTEGTIVRGDRTRVWQILSNIVSNAIRYSPEGGTIEISIGDAPADETDGRRMVEISVRDEGPGIPEEGAAKLFEPFFYRPSGLAGAHGAGLGLAIVKQLVELHGGRVSIRNAAAGGTVFSFTLPG